MSRSCLSIRRRIILAPGFASSKKLPWSRSCESNLRRPVLCMGSKPLSLHLLAATFSINQAVKMKPLNPAIPGDSGLSNLSDSLKQQSISAPESSDALLPHTFPDGKPFSFSEGSSLTHIIAYFTRALVSENNIRLPQTIAHRGYKAKYPENSLLAHRGAVEVGAHALETDINLTKDGIAILSHVNNTLS